MEEVIRKEILADLVQVIEILKVKTEAALVKLEELSEHSIEDVALHKDLDLISITVMIYSLYKVAHALKEKDKDEIVAELEYAKINLEKNNYGKYNHNVKIIFKLIRKYNSKIKEHLQDVLDAARIKKGSSLLQKGLSIGQAAGLMGLSNWDLQSYAGKTTSIGMHHEKIKAVKRLKLALEIFGVKH